MPLTARAAPAVRPQRAAAAGDQRSSTVVLVWPLLLSFVQVSR